MCGNALSSLKMFQCPESLRELGRVRAERCLVSDRFLKVLKVWRWIESEVFTNTDYFSRKIRETIGMIDRIDSREPELDSSSNVMMLAAAS